MAQYPQKSVVDGVAVVTLTKEQFEALVDVTLICGSRSAMLADVMREQAAGFERVAHLLGAEAAELFSHPLAGWDGPEGMQGLVERATRGVQLSPDVENFAGGVPEAALEPAALAPDEPPEPSAPPSEEEWAALRHAATEPDPFAPVPLPLAEAAEPTLPQKPSRRGKRASGSLA